MLPLEQYIALEDPFVIQFQTKIYPFQSLKEAFEYKN
jgi:hypothetical protein